jgi:hypothetical protein
MNKRINELAVQAGGIWQGGYVEQANGDSVYTDKKFVSGGDMDVEQFARLLVKECAKIVEDSTWNLPHGYKAVDQAKLIKQHFGVEL